VLHLEIDLSGLLSSTMTFLMAVLYYPYKANHQHYSVHSNTNGTFIRKYFRFNVYVSLFLQEASDTHITGVQEPCAEGDVFEPIPYCYNIGPVELYCCLFSPCWNDVKKVLWLRLRDIDRKC